MRFENLRCSTTIRWKSTDISKINYVLFCESRSSQILKPNDLIFSWFSTAGEAHLVTFCATKVIACLAWGRKKVIFKKFFKKNLIIPSGFVRRFDAVYPENRDSTTESSSWIRRIQIFIKNIITNMRPWMGRIISMGKLIL